MAALDAGNTPYDPTTATIAAQAKALEDIRVNLRAISAAAAPW